MKTLIIELPTCNKQRFESIVLSNLQFFALINSIIKFNVNFQKEFSDIDVKKYEKIFQSYGIEFNYSFHNYSVLSLCRFREDTHNISPSGKYILSLDDDIQIKNENYIYQLLQALLILENHEDCGLISFDSGYYRGDYFKKYDDKTVRITSKQFNIWTSGGILLRSPQKIYGGLFPVEARDLLGCHQDGLLGLLTRSRGQMVGVIRNNNYHHYDFRKDMKDAGYYRYNWGQEKGYNTINSYIKRLDMSKDRQPDNSVIVYPLSTSSLEQILQILQEIQNV